MLMTYNTILQGLVGRKESMLQSLGPLTSGFKILLAPGCRWNVPPPPLTSGHLCVTVSSHPWGNIPKSDPPPQREHKRRVIQSKTRKHFFFESV